jgi:hypothetical protein
MSTGLVVVLAVAALAPLVAVRLRLPGALLEIVAGIVLGPAVLGLVRRTRPSARSRCSACRSCCSWRFRGRPAPVPRHASASASPSL